MIGNLTEEGARLVIGEYTAMGAKRCTLKYNEILLVKEDNSYFILYVKNRLLRRNVVVKYVQKIQPNTIINLDLLNPISKIGRTSYWHHSKMQRFFFRFNKKPILKIGHEYYGGNNFYIHLGFIGFQWKIQDHIGKY